MYDIDGDFGQVRRVLMPLYLPATQCIDPPFHFKSAGWHRCNDLYKIERPEGLPHHILFFSVTDGGIIQMDDHPAVSIPASSVACIPAHHKHAYYTEIDKIWEFYWIDLCTEDHFLIDQIFSDQSIVNFSDLTPLTAELEAFLKNHKSDRQQFIFESSRLISNLYHSLLTMSYKKNTVLKQDELVHTIISQMEADCTLCWNLQDLSKTFYISIPQLIRRFKSATGLSPHQYLMNLRLQTAAIYLQHTGWPIEQISQKTGFSSSSNFIHQFQKQYKVTPGRYRANQ